MKNRLTKSIQRLRKEKKINDNSTDTKGLTAYSVKVFRNLTEKYDLSLTLNNNESNPDFKSEESLSLGAQMTLERIKKGENFKV
tara:strand:+ start:505 stop:756 length:252 start_codon:yes stop_codon:yes gene_type:complete